MSSATLLDAVSDRAVTSSRAGSIGRVLANKGEARGETLIRRHVGGLSRVGPQVRRRTKINLQT